MQHGNHLCHQAEKDPVIGISVAVMFAVACSLKQSNCQVLFSVTAVSFLSGRISEFPDLV